MHGLRDFAIANFPRLVYKPNIPRLLVQNRRPGAYVPASKAEAQALCVLRSKGRK